MGHRGIWASAARLAARWRRVFRPAARPGPARPVPAVPIEQSVTPNFLICLETGTRQVALKRHLRQTLHMSPGEYRSRWGLPPEYPMVAAAYGDRRNSVQCLPSARKHGLWRSVVAMYQELNSPAVKERAFLSGTDRTGRKEKNAKRG